MLDVGVCHNKEVSMFPWPTFLSGAALCAVACSPAVWAQTHDDEPYPEPRTIDYALVLPANMPHVLRLAFVNADGLRMTPSERQEVQQMMKRAPAEVLERLNQAQDLELDVAEAVLDARQSLETVTPKLHALVQLKLAATQAQIHTINRLQAMLGEERFAQLLRLARAPA
jgi:hypothetical protein